MFGNQTAHVTDTGLNADLPAVEIVEPCSDLLKILHLNGSNQITGQRIGKVDGKGTQQTLPVLMASDREKRPVQHGCQQCD